MIIRSAEFVKSATRPDHYPDTVMPEIAFAGRSNVGKSSLINTLLNRKKLVKTSSTPGRTQLINFFLINGQFGFVDLPGYGYAKVSKKMRHSWAQMIDLYVQKRPQLTAMVLIFDIRRQPEAQEFEILSWLSQRRLPVICVVTKSDKLSRNKQFNQRKRFGQILNVKAGQLILFSAKTRLGTEALWSALDPFIDPDHTDTLGDSHA